MRFSRILHAIVMHQRRRGRDSGDGSPRRDFGRMGNARRMRGAHALLSYRDAPLRAAVLQCYFFLA